MLVKAKLPKFAVSRKSKRQVLGFKHCKRISCNMCKFSPKFAKSITSSRTKETFQIKSDLSCESKNVIVKNKIKNVKTNRSILAKQAGAFLKDLMNIKLL